MCGSGTGACGGAPGPQAGGGPGGGSAGGAGGAGGGGGGGAVLVTVTVGGGGGGGTGSGAGAAGGGAATWAPSGRTGSAAPEGEAPIRLAISVPCASQSDRPSPYCPITKSPPATRCGSRAEGATPVSITATTTPAPVDSFHTAGMSNSDSAAGISRRSLPGMTPVRVQARVWRMGWSGPGGGSAGAGPGGTTGGGTAELGPTLVAANNATAPARAAALRHRVRGGVGLIFRA